MFLGGLYWIQLETQPIMMKFTTILLNAEFLRRITKCSRENFKFAVALLYPCNGTVACAPFTLQGSQVRNLYCPPKTQKALTNIRKRFFFTQAYACLFLNGSAPTAVPFWTNRVDGVPIQCHSIFHVATELIHHLNGRCRS